MKSLILSFLLIFCIGCSSSGGGTKSGSSRDPLLTEEIVASGAPSAYEAVQMRRPMWLSSRGVKSFSTRGSQYPIVYVNGMNYGEMETLRNIPAETVAEVRFIKAEDATIQFGTGHTAGVIMVTTRTGARN